MRSGKPTRSPAARSVASTYIAGKRLSGARFSPNLGLSYSSTRAVVARPCAGRSTDHAPDESDTVWIARTPQTPKLAVYQKMSNVLDPNMVSRLAGKRSVLVAENVKMKVVMRACFSARWQSRTQTKTLMKSSCWPAWLGECGCYCGNKHARAVSTPVEKKANIQKRMGQPAPMPLNPNICP